MTKQEFLQKHIFFGLKDLNTGFDVPTIKYFTEKEFEVVLKRIEALGCGVHGIEPWIGNEYFDVRTSHEPTDPSWYWKAFNEFKALAKKEGIELQYSASYYVPEGLLKV